MLLQLKCQIWLSIKRKVIVVFFFETHINCYASHALLSHQNSKFKQTNGTESVQFIMQKGKLCSTLKMQTVITIRIQWHAHTRMALDRRTNNVAAKGKYKMIAFLFIVTHIESITIHIHAFVIVRSN